MVTPYFRTRTGSLKGDVLVIPGAVQRAVLCLQHYLRLPTLLVLPIYLSVTIVSARGYSKPLPTTLA